MDCLFILFFRLWIFAQSICPNFHTVKSMRNLDDLKLNADAVTIRKCLMTRSEIPRILLIGKKAMKSDKLFISKKLMDIYTQSKAKRRLIAY